MRFRDMFTGEIRDTCSERKQSKTCRCKHPTFRGGRCHYRTCRHDTTTHYRSLADRITLSHEYDELVEGEKEMFADVYETRIKKHPEQFPELNELVDWINRKISKCGCGFTVRNRDLRYYPSHDNGIHIPFEDTKCWIYSHCPQCGYDLNFQKILNEKAKYEMRQAQ